MEKVIRAALVGFGSMGSNYAKMISAGLVRNMVLTGVCCRNEAGQNQLREEFPRVTIYTNTKEMVACETEYDMVIIVTPHKTHVPIAMEFAKLGKHILLDKPAGVSAGEVEQLADYCEKAGLAFGMIFNNRQLPVFKAAKEFLDSGALGSLHRAVWVCNSWYRSPAYHASAPWRSSWNGECGGLMINQNPHYLDMWNWFFGMPDRVYASLEFGRYNDFRVDDAADIQFYHDNGFHGTFVSATGEAPGVNRLEIWGSNGCLTLDAANMKLIFDENEISTEAFGAMNQVPFAGVPHQSRQLPVGPVCNPYLPVFENFARHLLCGDTLYADGWDGLRQVQLANAVYVSGWEERRVSVPVADEEFCRGLAARQHEEKE